MTDWYSNKKLYDARKQKKKKTHEEVCEMIRELGIEPAKEEPKQTVWDKVMQRRKELLEWKERIK